MNDITKARRILEAKFAQHYCHVSDIDKCPNKECTCRVAAEIKAYINTVISEPFSHLTLDDFTGRDGDKQLIPDEIALKVKRDILSYCWKDVKLNDLVGINKLNTFVLDSRSIMDARRENGDNVIIYANSEKILIGQKSQRKGKTFVASLIMREAIKRRAFPDHHGDTYDWIPFGSLVDKLKQLSMGNKDVSLSDVQYCDWLVVDDIRGDFALSAKGQNYISSLLDPFFFERMQDSLPTILVFKFDIMQPSMNLEQSFGVAINKIIHDPKTCIISLCDYSYDHR